MYGPLEKSVETCAEAWQTESVTMSLSAVTLCAATMELRKVELDLMVIGGRLELIGWMSEMSFWTNPLRTGVSPDAGDSDMAALNRKHAQSTCESDHVGTGGGVN